MLQQSGTRSRQRKGRQSSGHLYQIGQAKRKTFNDKVKVISLNVNGFRSREAEIRRFLNEQGKNCVLALSDTRLKKDTEIGEIADFTMLRCDKEYNTEMATAGGVALIIPKKWSCLRVPISTSGKPFEAISVILLPPDQGICPIKLVCVYNHPKNHFPQCIFSHFKNVSFNGKSVGGFLVGDFNCPHTSFGSRTTNEFGIKFLQAVNHENLIYFHLHSPTYYSSSTGQANILDMVMADEAGSRLVESCYVGDDVGSDHLPVVTKLTFRAKPIQKSKTNLALWAQCVDTKLENFVASDSIDENISNLNNLITAAKNLCTRTVVCKFKRILPLEIRQNIQLRKTVSKNRKKATSAIGQKVLTKIYNRLNHRIQNQIKEFDEREKQKLCGKICNSNNTFEMWKAFNNYKNKNKSFEEPEAPLTKPDGKLTGNNKEKCDEFARYLHSVHQTPESPLFDAAFKKKVDDEVCNETRQTETNSLGRIYIPQFERLLSETKANSSPGEDGISYDLMKLCSKKSKQIFCDIINQCLENNIFPKAWKEAKVRMLPKPGRDKTQSCNYRPISLLSCIGKIYERFIYAYLMKELEALKFINPNQAGFVKGRSTQEHLLRLTQGIYNGFKKRKCTMGLFLDVKAAFDAVWKNGLKYKIGKIGLSGQMKNILFSFLDNRTLKVFIDGIWSEVVELKAGTPQGSCLSPILYLIFVNDLTDTLDLTSTSCSQFADDVGLWATQSKAGDALRVIQGEVAKIEQWCRRWYVTLSPIKSKLILFSKCPRHREEAEEGLFVKLFNEEIPLSNEADFLGVKYDSRLTWEPQIKKITAKAYKRLNLLRAVSALSTTPNPARPVKA